MAHQAQVLDVKQPRGLHLVHHAFSLVQDFACTEELFALQMDQTPAVCLRDLGNQRRDLFGEILGWLRLHQVFKVDLERLCVPELRLLVESRARHFAQLSAAVDWTVAPQRCNCAALIRTVAQHVVRGRREQENGALLFYI